jgi:hypothetical protein
VQRGMLGVLAGTISVGGQGDRMLNGKCHLLAGIVMAAAGGLAVAGCSASASVSVGTGGTPSVPRSTVESNVATTLAKQLNQPVPKVVCPGDLAGKVDTVMYCSLTAQGATVSYPVKVEVTSVSGDKVNYSIEVSKTPSTFSS